MIKNIDKMFIWQGTQVMGTPALPIHVNFLLDEFKNIGEIPNFLGFLATSRKYRIGSHAIIQNIGQIKTMYKENEHETLLANVDTTIFLGSILIEDKEYVQKILGKTTIRQRSTSNAKTGLTTSYTPTEVPLMSVDEIGAINDPTQNRDDCLVIVRDTNPILCRKLNLTEHCRFPQCKKAEKSMGGAKLRSFYCNTGDMKAPIGAEINPLAEQKLDDISNLQEQKG
jgi:type IV secretory pathway TraG/TraD family ATPase VirD4